MRHGLLVLFLIGNLSAEEPSIEPTELPRIPATEPANALSTFEVRPGFSLELAASEPLVMDPIAMAFDEMGRMFVVEMRGYSERREDALGRIKMLTDVDGDGTFDEATIYAEGLKWPTAVICYDGGIFVGATPDIFYFKDENGDGRSDKSEVIFTGFGEGNPKLNMQALFNSFRWGPDNRIWGTSSRNGGKVRRPTQPESEAISVRGADFSFDPTKFDLRLENGTAQYGMDFDREGRRYVCSNSRHIQSVMWERSDFEPNPLFPMPNPIVDIAEDGAAAPVFRISPDEPWRIVRTRWRISGVSKGIVEGGGRVSGYFTSATGVTIYEGDAYPDEFHGNAFIGDVGSNLVHRKVLDHSRLQPVARRATDEQDIEFVRSRDNWFRPTSFANGPDGCLYITDMYREVIEHPWSLPPGIKKHLDLNSGNDRGRIYRVVPDGYQRPTVPNLAKNSNSQLSKFVSLEANRWHRDMARRLLFERGSPSAPSSVLSKSTLIDELPSPGQKGSDPWVDARFLHRFKTPQAAANYLIKNASSLSTLEPAICRAIGKSKDLDAAKSVLAEALKKPSTRSLIQISELAQGLESSGLKLSTLDVEDELDHFFAFTKDLNDEEVSLLEFPSRSEVVANLLKERIRSKQTDGVAAVNALLATQAGAPFKFLFENWEALSEPAQKVTLSKAIVDAGGSGLLLDQQISLNESQQEQLRNHSNKAIAKRATERFPPPIVASREEVLANYQPALQPGKGNATRGAEIFMRACMICHQAPDGSGHEVGPAIATFKNAGRDSILTNILDPNREVAPQYQAYIVTLEDESVLTGIIASESVLETTIRMPGGLEKTVPRKQIASMKGLGQTLMTVGIEHQISVDQMADLLAFIEQ